MSKTIARSMLFALVGVFALSLHAEIAWTKVEGVPGDWSPLSNNLLLGKNGETTGTTSYLTPVAQNITRLTDGVVPTSRSYSEMLGFAKDATVSWNFDAPKTLERVRITTCDITDGRGFDDITISDVMVKRSGSDEWVSLNCGPVAWSGSNDAGIMLYVMLEDLSVGRIAEGVTGLLVKFGQHNTLAQYYSEIEAVGFAEATGPVLGAFDVAPAKTKATLSGSIADVGTDATECDVYLSIDSAEAVKIAEGVTGSFEYQIQGLTAGTTYAYELSVSNNAPTAKGTVISDEFTTLSTSDSTVVWAKELYMTNDWRALECNVLSNVRGTMGSGQSPNGYGTNDLIVLSDGYVPSVAGKDWIVGISPNHEIDWNLAVPVTIEQLRISSSYLEDPHFSGVNIASVKVKCVGSDEWVEVPGSSSGKIVGDGTTKNIICAILSDIEYGYIAQNVTALKVVFGAAVYVNANYYVEIEAVGYAEATGPVVGTFNITPAKTKATISGSLADVGTDATSCDVYLSIDGGAATKIAEGVTGSFDYTLKGLTAGTTYAYELSMSNNAPTVRGTVRSGSFTTLAADAQTASWSQGEYAPSEWTALENNILNGLSATEKSGWSTYASQDMAKLTDGSVPNPAAGSETVGFTPNGTIAWAFEGPMALKSIRISSLWETTAYNGISVNAIQVKYPDSTDWVTLDVPTVQWAGGTKIGQTETLSDAETGYLARNVVGLKITFGAQKAAVANYYAEIEAVGRLEPKPGFVVFVR